MPADDEDNPSVAGRLLARGQQQIHDVLDRGRLRLRAAALQRDLDHFWIRLGKTAWRLVEAGEISHPAVEKAVERIRELEVELDELNRRMGR